ncbi:MAG: cob(I)yrinic acid a,c-diamide adenosyltransferase [Bradymonadales bacterium]|nr:cob(I)yrinic acid a,c-diamide adenosyltransferase [Bradymonadales bacterium]
MAEDKGFAPPQRIAIHQVTTRTGDSGKTRLVGGQLVAKHSIRVETYGTVDELNAAVGAAGEIIRDAPQARSGLSELQTTLRRVQHELFNLGSLLATLPQDLGPRQPRIQQEDVERLEAEIERLTAILAPLQSFVLPGGSRLNCALHQCRTICRRAERRCCELAEREEVDRWALIYLNRLSDAFFVWGRWVIQVEGRKEVLWDPNSPTGHGKRETG